QLPVVLSRNHFYDKKIVATEAPLDPEMNTSAKLNSTWQKSDYKTGWSWLKPRMVLPVVEEIGNREVYEVGLGLHSNSLLQQQAYSLQASYFKERIWYDLRYQNKQFFPGFEARIFNEPDLLRLAFSGQEGAFFQTFLRQEHSFALSIPIPIMLQQNVWYSSLFLKPEIRRSQIRFFDVNGNHPSDFAGATIGNIFGQLNFRLLQNI